MPRSRKRSRKGPHAPTSNAKHGRGNLLADEHRTAQFGERACVVCGKKGVPSNSFAGLLVTGGNLMRPVNDEGDQFACVGCTEKGLDLFEGPDLEA